MDVSSCRLCPPSSSDRFLTGVILGGFQRYGLCGGRRCNKLGIPSDSFYTAWGVSGRVFYGCDFQLSVGIRGSVLLSQSPAWDRIC
jgi:hypothetical protein